MTKLEQALYFYLFLIVAFTVAGMFQFKSDPKRGFLNGLCVGVALSLFLFNIYRDQLY